MFDHHALITLLLAPVVAYLVGAILFSIGTYVQENMWTSISLTSSNINSGHSL
ncbi:hypothetical protein GPLA_3948 [Paraglaciecola polaris LMG 21857]|uniref:Uncharacterized protein n=1 Tax=Paraglaciecola polaris LMG 21857 TaxID=1129793 RepID=K6ZX83_9ALTE|nr:hypothetical protein GPLA_3948 [Paraglaciecola polaris LMG 21857]